MAGEPTIVVQSSAMVLRSIFLFFEGTGPFKFDAGRYKCYSFTLVNTGSNDLMLGKGDEVIIPNPANKSINILDFPRVGNYLRDDVLTFNFGAVAGTSYIRAEINVADTEEEGRE